MKKDKVYICGGVTTSFSFQQAFANFKEMEDLINKSEQYEAVNPFRLVFNELDSMEKNLNYYIGEVTKLLLKCQYITYIDGYLEDRVPKIERAIAKAANIDELFCFEHLKGVDDVDQGTS